MRTERERGADAAVLSCRGLGVDFAGVPALADVGLTVAPHELVALLGASGSGKSTLLHAVAGLVHPSGGEIWVAGQLVANVRDSTPPERRAVGMVFQNFALWPHLCVLDTVAYPLRRAGRSRGDARAAAGQLLHRLGIAHVADRRPAELSGGEQQRVGLARALARDARLYLLDEPTAHLDTHLRDAFQAEVLTRQRETGAAAVYATHDAAEALRLADRVAVLDCGRLIQLGTPQAVYAEPVSVASAVLTGSCSVLSGTARRAGDGMLWVDLGAGDTLVAGGGAAAGAARPAELVVRPDWVTEGGPLAGRIGAVGFRGAYTEYRVESSAGAVLLHVPGPPAHGVGEPLPWGIRQGWVLGGESAAFSAERADGTGMVEPVVDDVEV